MNELKHEPYTFQKWESVYLRNIGLVTEQTFEHYSRSVYGRSDHSVRLHLGHRTV